LSVERLRVSRPRAARYREREADAAEADAGVARGVPPQLVSESPTGRRDAELQSAAGRIRRRDEQSSW
jgi:hypothetical protein